MQFHVRSKIDVVNIKQQADTKISEKLMTEDNKIITAKRRKVANDTIAGKHMKATGLGVHPVQECSSLCGSGRDWADLDPDLLEEILSCIPIHDLFNATFSDYILLNQDVCPAFLGEPQSEKQYSKIAESLSRLLQLALEGEPLQNWIFSINTIFLPYDIEILDRHIQYIAKRTPYIKHLMLLNTPRITVVGLINATRNWRHLKEIPLGSMDRYKCTCFLLLRGTNCQQLEYLHLRQRGMVIDESFASLIVENLPMVKKLEFGSCRVFPGALKGVFLGGINRHMQTAIGIILSNQFYDPACLVENFAMSWTECSGGYTCWHPMFTSYDDA
ncbi:hypothetical protein Cgig2_016458 [Carnegiea gigantea]|uniref:Uncharacterized protein n=1 Tax=Carnegiea gigantea TaxID=171969 RepID=A0A9Q1K5A1_9CARY|nr:hypothetical protein Cgig2_016458 [Carnegiea gigantea]